MEEWKVVGIGDIRTGEYLGKVYANRNIYLARDLKDGQGEETTVVKVKSTYDVTSLDIGVVVTPIYNKYGKLQGFM